MRGGSSPATARQLGRIDSLIAERDTSGMVVPRHLSHLDIAGASRLITELEQQPRRPHADVRPARVPVNLNGAGPGVYEIGGDVFRLRVNQAGTAVYPERLVAHASPPRWDYAPDVARRILPSQRITEEVAAELGRASTVCVICGTPLEADESKRVGIGPTCLRNLRRATLAP